MSNGWFRLDTPCSWYGVVCNEEKQVRELYLQVNGLTGSLPPELQNLSNLEKLALQRNQIGGQLPPGLGSLGQLLWLDVSQNQITGTLPLSLTQLTQLEQLNLGHNQLQGALPVELGQMLGLKGLYLHFNQFNGPIPAELGDLTNLRELYLSNNQLSGALPETLGQLAELRTLHLEANQLTGELPAALGQLGNLERLAVQENLLSGALPAELAGLSKLSSLTINSNTLQGEVPLAFGQLTRLGISPGDVVDFRYNGLFSGDSELAGKLSSFDPNWLATQTVTPQGLKAISTEAGVQVSWEPIPYQVDGGYYEISYAESAEGPFALHGVTADKAAATYSINGLTVGKEYYVRIRTYTPPHEAQKNELWSSYSSVASVLFDGKAPEPGKQPGFPLYLPMVRK